ncbi:UNVERIFIED_CONTAM: hypothetical protein FKN15_016714 [Acipenser sinensis]
MGCFSLNVGVLLCVLLHEYGVHGISFYLPPRARKCLREEIRKDVLVTGQYEVTELHDVVTNLKVSFEGATEQLIVLNIKHGTEAKNYENIAKAEKLKPLEVKLRQMEDLSESIAKELSYMKSNAEHRSNTNGMWRERERERLRERERETVTVRVQLGLQGESGSNRILNHEKYFMKNKKETENSLKLQFSDAAVVEAVIDKAMKLDRDMWTYAFSSVRAESTSSRVLGFSLLSMLCLVSLAVWQVFYLRRFFKSKRLIE